MRICILTATLALACAIIASCVARPDDGNAPAKPVRNEHDEQANREWLDRNQLKTLMRHMWIDSNRIWSATQGDARPPYDEVWAAAEDIRRRASDMHRHWDQIHTHLEEVLVCAEEDDRIGAAYELRTAGAGCDGCHMAVWSPAYLHVTNGVVDAWLKGMPTPMEEDEMTRTPPPDLPFRRVMQQLWGNYQSVRTAIATWDLPTIKSETPKMIEVARKNSIWWKGVVTEAETMIRYAQAEKREDANGSLKDAYVRMTGICAACHAQTVGEVREIMNPIPWKLR